MFSDTSGNFWTNIKFQIIDAVFYILWIQATAFAVNIIEVCYLIMFLVCFVVYDQRSKFSLQIVAQSNLDYSTLNLWPIMFICSCAAIFAMRMYMQQNIIGCIVLFGVVLLNFIVGDIFVWSKKCCNLKSYSVHVVAQLFLVSIPILLAISFIAVQKQILNNEWNNIVSMFLCVLWLRICVISVVCLLQNE